jgi:osmotically-inducible protein OsmY
MMKKVCILALLCTSIALGGCGSFLASMESNTMEEDPGERTVGQQLEDENIETKAIVNIHAANEAFDDAHLVVVSYNGYVLLAGQVNSEALKAQATDVLRKIRNVRRIYNELEVASPSSAMARSSDTWITTKLKGYFLGSSAIEGGRVKVLTENGVVYLMGLATQAEADRISDKAAGVSGVQRVVRIFEIID